MINEISKSIPDEIVYVTQHRVSHSVVGYLEADSGQSMSCCDCEDDCNDRNRCSCWKMTLAGSRYSETPVDQFGYVNKRLYSDIQTGIFECNDNCKCSVKCTNRVAQWPVKNNFELFKTPKCGWGVRCQNDLPRGAFIACYFGELMSEECAIQKAAKGHDDNYMLSLDFYEESEAYKTAWESYHAKQNDIASEMPNGEAGNTIEYIPAIDPELAQLEERNSTRHIIDAKRFANFSRYFNVSLSMHCKFEFNLN